MQWRRGRELLASVAGCGAAIVDDHIVVLGGGPAVPASRDKPPSVSTDAVQVLGRGTNWRSLDGAPIIDAADAVSVAAGRLAAAVCCPGGRLSLVSESFDGCDELGVTIAGVPAPILRRTRCRIDVLVPELPAVAGETVALEVATSRTDARVARVAIASVGVSPEILVQDFSVLDERGLGSLEPDYRLRASALARNADGSINCPAQPAAPGSTVSLAVTGLGTATAFSCFDELEVRVGAKNCPVTGVEAFAGYPGIWLLDFDVPTNANVTGAVLTEVVLVARGVVGNATMLAIHVGEQAAADVVPFSFGAALVLGGSINVDEPRDD
jgi:uncharacterized protein (TIGR03437 family)